MRLPRYLPIRRTVAACLAVAAGLTFGPAVPAAAAEPTFAIVNSASYEVGAVPRGARLTVFTSVPITGQHATFAEWVTVAAGGLRVNASCGQGTSMDLPISYIGPSGDGTQVNLYYPNEFEPDGWGRCDSDGISRIQVWAAQSHGGFVIEQSAMTLGSHPGIFSVGTAPAGSHIDGYSAVRTPLETCAASLPATPGVCRVSTVGEPGVLELFLTGAERFACRPCDPRQIAIELAPAGAPSMWVPQFLYSLERDGIGTERATVYLSGIGGGEYLMRVRAASPRQVDQRLRVELGAPA
jgi:hypothetical protein